MQDYYQLFNVEDVQKDEAAILEVLTAILQKKLPNDLRLLNYYKEIPINFASTIDYIDRGVAELTVHPTQALAILTQKMTFLKSSHFQHNVIAKVQKIQVEKCRIFIAQFSYVQIRSERRENIRVKVTNPFEASFQCDSHVIQGTLNDISVNGLSLLAPAQNDITEGATGIASLNFGGTKYEILGTLLRIIETDALRKYLFKLETTPQIEGVISQFIFQLQNEIIRELKNLDVD